MNIKDLRKAKGLTLTELATRVGVSAGTISRWESGEIANMRRDRIALLAKALNVKPTDLLGLPNEEFNDQNLLRSPISEVAMHTYQYVPHSVSAGELTTMESINFIPRVNIPDFMMGRYAGNKNIILMPVNGESMNNVIQNEAIIAVLTNVTIHDIHDGDIVVIKNSGDYTVKRFYNDIQRQEFIFKPDSTDMSFRDIIISYSNSDDLYLIGKVVMYNVLF